MWKRRRHHHVVVWYLRCNARGDNKPVFLCIILKNPPEYGIAKSYIYHLIHYDGVGATKTLMKTMTLTMIRRQMIMRYYVFFNCNDGTSHIHIHQKYYNVKNSPHGYWLPW